MTGFILGSTTKAFTTMVIALLKAEGKLDWDKVAQPLPQPAEKLMYGGRASGSVNTTAEDMCRGTKNEIY